MAAGRKLQAEIDKVLKKVEEGIEEFNHLWESVHNATHANQREKFESELKAQIKKLQRDREQIKTWASDKSIKDKSGLAEARKKIEVEMERFKEFERDLKTKTYSKEGLSKGDKTDPFEETRNSHRSWIRDCMDNLGVQVDEIDADLELQQAAGGGGNKKKGKKKEDPGEDSAAVVHMKHIQETHKWHVTKLEQLLRKLDNYATTSFEDLDDLRENVEFYVDGNSREEGEFQEFETIYEGFGLESIEDYLTKDRDKGDKDTEDADASSAPGDRADSLASHEKPASTKEEKEKPLPSKHTKPPSSPATRAARAGGARSGDEDEKKQPSTWPPMMSVWQNPAPSTARDKEKAPPPPAPPGPNSASSTPPPKPGPPVSRPAPTLPPPTQPAPDRPPPPGQAPMLNAPPQQPPPKPAPHQPAPQHQPPAAPPKPAPHQPPQAPPQPPLPSPPMGSPPGPQGSLAGIVGALPMPAPPPMPPPAPQDGVAGAGASAPGSVSEPPVTAPPPPPPPLRPPPPPSPVPASPGPPSANGKQRAQSGGDREPPQWPPPAPHPGDEHMQQAPKVPPPSEAPPPPTESPPPPPPGAGEHGSAPESRAAARSGASSPAPRQPSPDPIGAPPPPPPPVSSAGSGPASSPGGAAQRVPATAQAGAFSAAEHAAAAAAAASFGTLPAEARAAMAAAGGAASSSAGGDPAGVGEGSLGTAQLDALDLLSASFRNLPSTSDGRRKRKYVPRNPYVHLDSRGNAAYPMHPTRNYEGPEMFEKYNLDTLFFIFYYQQGSYQQHLAAKELKKLSWRYHTKYLTWFQRHEEPRLTASDFERGAYVFFDHHSGWCQLIKSDFQFEYQFLEDEPM